MPLSPLLFMIILHFVAMYILMYAMVNTVGYAYPNFNQIYMAALMTSPMLVFEVMLMGNMYSNKFAMKILLSGGLLVFGLAWFAIRQQTAIGDQQFLRSMIPHHAGAILMCEQAKLNDPEIIELCEQILASQQAEINQMEQILDRLN